MHLAEILWTISLDGSNIMKPPLTTRVTDKMEAWGSPLVTEFEVLDENGSRVGYWAYGSWDPAYTYQGEDLEHKEDHPLIEMKGTQYDGGIC